DGGASSGGRGRAGGRCECTRIVTARRRGRGTARSAGPADPALAGHDTGTSPLDPRGSERCGRAAGEIGGGRLQVRAPSPQRGAAAPTGIQGVPTGAGLLGPHSGSARRTISPSAPYPDQFSAAHAV